MQMVMPRSTPTRSTQHRPGRSCRSVANASVIAGTRSPFWSKLWRPFSPATRRQTVEELGTTWRSSCSMSTPGSGKYPERADHMAEYVLASRPRGEVPVMLPGQVEQLRRAEASEVIIDGPTWAAIVERAERVGVPVPPTDG